MASFPDEQFKGQSSGMSHAYSGPHGGFIASSLTNYGDWRRLYRSPVGAHAGSIKMNGFFLQRSGRLGCAAAVFQQCEMHDGLCLFACENPSTHSAQDSMPPCHAHHHAPADQVPSACAHPLIIADTAHSAAQLILPDFIPAFFSPESFVVPPSRGRAAGLLCVSSPPGLSALSSVILRI